MRGQALHVWSGRIEQEDFLKKKKTLQQQLQSPLYPAAWFSCGAVRGIEPKYKAPGMGGGEGTPQGVLRPQALTRQSAHLGET